MSNKELILHFDINGTITNFDSTESPDDSQMVNMILSKNSFGTILDNQWILNQKPFIESSQSISYYNYLKSQHMHQYKEKSFAFTENNQPGQLVREYHDQMLKNGDLSALFPSFIKVLNDYQDAKIVFRTFGNDADMILDQLKNRYGYDKKFTKGQIYRSDSQLSLKLENGQEYCGVHEINQLINLSQSNWVIREDYKYWSQNNRSRSSGKVFIVDENYDQLFFDDNDCVVCYHVNGSLIEECSKSIKINTISAQTDENYYVQYIENCH